MTSVKDFEELKFALEESLKLQSHYADLLNNYDGGMRMNFSTAEAWTKRLKLNLQWRMPTWKNKLFEYIRPEIRGFTRPVGTSVHKDTKKWLEEKTAALKEELKEEVSMSMVVRAIVETAHLNDIGQEIEEKGKIRS